MERPPLLDRVTRFGHRLRSTNLWVIDAVLATAFLAFVLLGHYGATGRPDVVYRDPNALSFLACLASAVPYYFRRHAPLAVLIVSEIGVVLLTVGDYRTGAAPTVLFVGVYTVAAWSPPRERRIGAAVLAVGLAIVGLAGIPGSTSTEVTFTLFLYVAAYLVGTTMRTRRLYSEQLEARADAAERDRDERAKRAVAEERLHIAQELHDVVAHSMGVIAVQAGVGAHVIDTDPQEAKKSLQAISQTSRATLTEIRRMLGVLRDDGAAYEPAPGLADLDRLIHEVGDAGVAVRVRYEGTRTDLPPGVDFTAYRIVQEALTNVLKHAGRASVTVVVGYDPDNSLRLEITDDGRGVNGRAVPGGHGLLGMRERVGVYGGTLEAGPRTGGGYRVAVTLPYGEPA